MKANQAENMMNILKRVLVDNNTYVIFIILFVVSCFLSENFFTVMNLRNIALQQAARFLSQSECCLCFYWRNRLVGGFYDGFGVVAVCRTNNEFSY